MAHQLLAVVYLICIHLIATRTVGKYNILAELVGPSISAYRVILRSRIDAGLIPVNELCVLPAEPVTHMNNVVVVFCSSGVSCLVSRHASPVFSCLSSSPRNGSTILEPLSPFGVIKKARTIISDHFRTMIQLQGPPEKIDHIITLLHIHYVPCSWYSSRAQHTITYQAFKTLSFHEDETTLCNS